MIESPSRREARVSLGAVIFTLTSIAFAWSAAEPSAFRACAISYTSLDTDAAPGIRSRLDRYYPHGTREYLGAPIVFYVLSAPGHSTLSVAERAEFRCTRAGLAVRDVRSASFVVYPRGSRVYRERSTTHYLVKRGEPLPREVRDGLRSGTVRYARTL
jgi:hypothetical protein